MAKSFEGGTKKSPDENNDKVISYVIARAQEIAKREGLRIGQTVAHPSDRTVYALKEIKHDTAVVWLPDQENTAKEFPLSELFDPNVAGRELAQYTSDQDHGFRLKARPG